MKAKASYLQKQSGMVLLFCLLFLTALTLLGLSAATDAILQSQLSANLQESERAKQSAMATLLWAEDWLLEWQKTADEPCVLPCDNFQIQSSGAWPVHPEHMDISWWQSKGYEAGMNPASGVRLTSVANGSYDPPIWLIEQIHQAPLSTDPDSANQTWYRILARGSGQLNSHSISVVESTVMLTNEDPPGVVQGRVSWRKLR